MSTGIDGVFSSPYTAATSSPFATTIPPTATDQLSQNPFADPSGPFANLNLTDQQQQQIQQLFSTNSSNSGAQTPTQLFSQVESVLTPQQQQTLRGDLETAHAHHHHHGGGGGSDANNPLSQLDLTSAQQSQIDQILNTAQTNGTASSDVVSEINNVLTTSQQQQLASLFGSYTANGTAPTNTPPFQVNTNA